jgi:hypothetical protein
VNGEQGNGQAGEFQGNLESLIGIVGISRQPRVDRIKELGHDGAGQSDRQRHYAPSGASDGSAWMYWFKPSASAPG